MQIDDFVFPESLEKSATKLLNFVHGSQEERNVVNFLSKYSDVVKKEPYEEQRKIIEVKNIITRKLICEQVAANGWFHTGPIWGKDTCTACSGLGEIYRFERAPIKEKCSCDNGFVWIKCHRCKNGIYVRQDGTEVACKFCSPPVEQYKLTPQLWENHRGFIRKRCKKCLGNKTLKRLPKILPKIRSTTPCKICGGLGFLIKDRIFNEELRDKLSKLSK